MACERPVNVRPPGRRLPHPVCSPVVALDALYRLERPGLTGPYHHWLQSIAGASLNSIDRSVNVHERHARSFAPEASVHVQKDDSWSGHLRPHSLRNCSESPPTILVPSVRVMPKVSGPTAFRGDSCEVTTRTSLQGRGVDYLLGELTATVFRGARTRPRPPSGSP